MIAKTIATCGVAVGALIATAGPASGAGDIPAAGARVIDVSAFVGGGWGDPAGISQSHCAAGFEFDSHRLADDASARALIRTGPDGVVEKLWQTSCVDPATGLMDPTTILEFWLADVTPADIVRAVYKYVPDYLDPPEPSWPNMNTENGWLFVKVPMDFRVQNLGPVTVTATVSNSLGADSASITATPATLHFVSGEGGGTSCTADQAREGYAPGSPGACAYTYNNSSSTAPNGYSFPSTMTMDWALESTPSDPIVPATLDTTADQLLPVSEVQAVVTCYGNDC